MSNPAHCTPVAFHRQRGATLIEYVLIVAVIALAVFAASQTGLVTAIQGVFTDAQSCIGGTCS
ncbi:Flp family type IVb pilin [Salinisphaera aquimarina]